MAKIEFSFDTDMTTVCTQATASLKSQLLKTIEFQTLLCNFLKKIAESANFNKIQRKLAVSMRKHLGITSQNFNTIEQTVLELWTKVYSYPPKLATKHSSVLRQLSEILTSKSIFDPTVAFVPIAVVWFAFVTQNGCWVLKWTSMNETKHFSVK